METTPPDPDGSTRSFLPGLVLRIYCYLLVLLVIYVLSAGPLYWTIHDAFYLNKYPFVQKLYLPLVLVASESEAVSEFLDWYVGFWI